MRLIKTSLAAAAALLCTCAFAEVNINTADHRQLTEQLRNIGPGKAAAIIEHRERHGHFTDVEQLTEVTGIGDATLEMNRHLLTIGGEGGDVGVGSGSGDGDSGVSGSADGSAGDSDSGDGGHAMPSASPPPAASAARERLPDAGY